MSDGSWLVNPRFISNAFACFAAYGGRIVVDALKVALANGPTLAFDKAAWMQEAEGPLALTRATLPLEAKVTTAVTGVVCPARHA
jgi:hypothetical protein